MAASTDTTSTTTTTTTAAAANGYSNTVAIVGGGPAGCVLASRILSTTDRNVLLLERGPSDECASTNASTTSNASLKDMSRFPAGLNTNAQWMESQPQTGLQGRTTWLHTAEGLGGASILNAGVFLMGNKTTDYSNWPGKHFTAANFERAVQQVREIHQPQVVSTGLLPKDTPGGLIETGVQTKLGLAELSLDKDKDMIWIEQDGIYRLASSAMAKTGDGAKTRRTVADSFLPQSLRSNNPRLTILTNANVTRVLMEQAGAGSDNRARATGLEVETTTKFMGYNVYTTKKQLSGFAEVVLSSGAIGTPRLLMRSGIGPKDELEKAGIPTVMDLPAVGKGLWDHPIAFFPVEIASEDDDDDDAPKDFPPCCTPSDNNASIKTYGDNKKIAFSHMGPHIAYNTPAQIMVPMFKDSGLSRRFQVFMLDALRSQIFPKTNTKIGVAAVGLLTVASRGSVSLETIDPAYLTDKEDLDAFADAFGDMLEILRNAGMKIAIPDFEMNPPDREALVKSLCMLAGPFWHFAGSCSGVVDYETLKVKGVENLRIVDTSIFPNNITANTQGPTMATAYLAGELFANKS